MLHAELTQDLAVAVVVALAQSWCVPNRRISETVRIESARSPPMATTTWSHLVDRELAHRLLGRAVRADDVGQPAVERLDGLGVGVDPQHVGSRTP